MGKVIADAMKKTRILITGSTGFVGKNVKEYLERKDEYEIFAPTSRELDCTDEIKVREYLDRYRFDYVLHFAVYGDGIDKSKDASKALEYNLRIFLNFQKCSDLYGKMFYTGSGAEYDKRFDIVNVKEDAIGISIPTDHYGLMKYTVNQIIEKSRNIYNLRLFGVFGKYEYYPTKFISNICCKAIKDLPFSIRQNVYFDYLWIDDLIRMLEFFLHNTPKHHSYNMVSGQKISLLEICDIVNKVSGKNKPVYVCREGLANEYTASNLRFMQENVDFKYTPIEKSIKMLYDWYVDNEDSIDIYRLLY